MLVVLLYFIGTHRKPGPAAKAAILRYLSFMAAFDLSYIAVTRRWIPVNLARWRDVEWTVGFPFF
jgi:hypothetical protein